MAAELNQEKSIMGILISYYRKNSGINIDTILHNKDKYFNDYCTNCLKCRDVETICSYKTFKKIESGGVVRNECIYYRLCENLKFNVCFERNVFEKMNHLRNSIVNGLCNYSYSALSSLLSEICNECNHYKNYFYIHDILELYYDIVNFTIYEKIPSAKKIDLYLFLRNKLNDTDNKLLISFLYNLSFYIPELIEYRHELLEECRKYYQDPLFLNVRLIDITSNNTLDAYYQINEIIYHEQHSFTTYQTFLLYDYLALVEMNGDAYERAYATMQICLEIINNGADFNPATIKKAYRQIGMITFCLQKYEESIEYFLKAKQLHQLSSLSIQTLLLYKALEITNQKDRLRSLLAESKLYPTENHVEKKINAYYYLKYDQPFVKTQISLLEDYICSEMKPLANRMGKIFKDIFREELMEFIAITTNYKKLYLFEK